jgi:GT2 family glycosyltransferase
VDCRVFTKTVCAVGLDDVATSGSRDLAPAADAGLPLVLSIIIVNYNGGQLLDRCLESIYEAPPRCTFEVLLVDNASTDGSGDRVAGAISAVRYIRSKANLGLAKAFNVALADARGLYVLSLDSDTRLFPGALDEMVQRLESQLDVGAVGGWLLNPDMTPQKTARRRPSALNALFGRRSLLTRLIPRNRISRRYLMDDEPVRKDAFEVDWVSTAALMTRREVMIQTCGLDEGFFVYWVDADLCARIRACGWKIEAVPRARVIHDENLKQGRRTRRRTRMIVDFHRGAYRYYRRHHVSHPASPKNLAALLGLSVRAFALVVSDYVITSANAWRASRLGGRR